MRLATAGRQIICGKDFDVKGLPDFRPSTYKRGGESDLVAANSVSIDPTAMLDLSENGTASLGMAFTILESRATPISGTFANLPDGATITSGNNTFQANYEGGDGNDLTLTFVP